MDDNIAFQGNYKLSGCSMRLMSKVIKVCKLLTRPVFSYAAFRHGVAAAVEHLEVIKLSGANMLIDVGANKGQFSLAFRALRPSSRIVAFEPLKEAADRFAALFAQDRRVELRRVAISDSCGGADFYVADRADSSSLLHPGIGQKTAFGVYESRVIHIETDTLENQLSSAELEHPVFMKIDVQGAEMRVLHGAEYLDKIDFIYVELSFIELYDGQPLFDEVAAYLCQHGFSLVGAFNQISTSAFGPTQADFLFKRSSGLSILT